MARPRNMHDENKNNILRVAETLFLEKGYKQTSIDDILRSTELSKGGFYHYFKSKDELLSSSINNMIGDIVKFINTLSEDKSLNGEEKFRQFISFKTNYQNENTEYAMLLAKLMYEEEQAKMIYYMSISKALVPPLAKIIQQGADEDFFNIDNGEDVADIIVRIMSSYINSAYYDIYQKDTLRKERYFKTLGESINRILGTKNQINLFSDEE